MKLRFYYPGIPFSLPPSTLLKYICINSLTTYKYSQIGHFQSVSSLTPGMSGVLQIDWNGNIVASYYNNDGTLPAVCDVIVFNDKLFTGAPHGQDFIGAVPAPPLLKKAFSSVKTTPPPKTAETVTREVPKPKNEKPKPVENPTNETPKGEQKKEAPKPKVQEKREAPNEPTYPKLVKPDEIVKVKPVEKPSESKPSTRVPTNTPKPTQPKPTIAPEAATTKKPEDKPKPAPKGKPSTTANAEARKEPTPAKPKPKEKNPSETINLAKNKVEEKREIPIKEEISSDTMKPNKETLKVIKKDGPAEIPNPNL